MLPPISDGQPGEATATSRDFQKISRTGSRPAAGSRAPISWRWWRMRGGRKRAAGGAHRRRQDPGRFPAHAHRSWRIFQLAAHGWAKRARKRGLHTLYISPLKALAVDVARNLDAPIREMDLPVTVETRTGDTPPARRQRQRYAPPDILLTTPEQLSLLLAHPRSAQMFESLRTVVLDELHALYNSKRGDLLALGLARLQTLAPGHRRVGLSATVKDPRPCSVS